MGVSPGEGAVTAEEATMIHHRIANSRQIASRCRTSRANKAGGQVFGVEQQAARRQGIMLVKEGGIEVMVRGIGVEACGAETTMGREARIGEEAGRAVVVKARFRVVGMRARALEVPVGGNWNAVRLWYRSTPKRAQKASE